MLINFFYTLKKSRVPVSIKELLDLLKAMEHNFAFGSIDDFYLLARTCLIKDEKFYEFYRSMTAYRNTFSNKGDVLLIQPDSDFFKYMNSNSLK